jgi:cytochrome c oxidase cbb3-type subunit III
MSNNHDKRNDADPDEDELRAHVFDGIQEYDKKLPNWWLMTLYGAIVFSIGYWFYFHIFEVGNMPEQKLAQAQARAAAFAAAGGGGGFTDEKLIAMSLDSGLVASGKTAFGTSCAACHGAGAEGGIGPNLIDGEWIHGGLPTQILQSIQEGIPARGMPGWRSMLGETRSAEVAAFIISLNPAAFEGAGSEAAVDEGEPAAGGI